MDGQALDEPYTKEPTYTTDGTEFPLTLKENEVFIMGDNRNHSTDSRSYLLGPVDEGYIQGKAIFLLIPWQNGGDRQAGLQPDRADQLRHIGFFEGRGRTVAEERGAMHIQWYPGHRPRPGG